MYTIKILLENKNNSYAYFNKMFFIKFKIQNIFISYIKRQLDKLNLDKEYIEAKKLYALEKNGKNKSKSLKKYTSIMNDRIKYLGLTKDSLEKYSKKIQKRYKKYISSQVAQVIANNTYQSLFDYLYGDGKHIYHKKLDSIHSISAKSLTNGIKLDLDKNLCTFNKFECKFILKKYNTYLKECLEKDKSNIKYCRLIREPFNNGYRYYVQLVIDSTPILKFSKGKGITGIDPGVSSIAVTTDSSCMLEDLAPNIEEHNKRIVEIQKKMERSRKETNPNNYNSDGTIKKGSKFKKTKNYKHLNKIFKTLHRKRKCYIKQNQERLANKIIKESNTIFYEEMDFKALGKRSKKTEKRDTVSTVTTKSGETKKIKKFKRKKRFGKTLLNKAPSQFLTILILKCAFYEVDIFPIDTKNFKASQYNHIFDEYRKKELNERWNILYNSDFEPILIQRDLYSSFLIKNTNEELNHPNREKCLKSFNNFIDLHNKCIEEVLKTNHNRLSCFGF